MRITDSTGHVDSTEPGARILRLCVVVMMMYIGKLPYLRDLAGDPACCCCLVFALGREYFQLYVIAGYMRRVPSNVERHC